MAKNKMKTWLKWGIIGAMVGLALFLLLIISALLTNGFCPVYDLYCINDSTSCSVPECTLASQLPHIFDPAPLIFLSYSLVIGFVLGSIIGLIIQKIKKK